MPWKLKGKIEQRFDLVRQMAAGKLSVSELCRRFLVSRQTAYKWRKRFRLRRLSGLRDKSRRPLSLAVQTTARWLRRVRQFRRRRPTRGARKIRPELSHPFGSRGAPLLATISRRAQRL